MNGKIFPHLAATHAETTPLCIPRPNFSEVALKWRKVGRGFVLSIELRSPTLPAPITTTIEAGSDGTFVVAWPQREGG